MTCKESGRWRWDATPPDGWPSAIGFQNPNRIPKVDLIIVIRSFEGMFSGGYVEL